MRNGGQYVELRGDLVGDLDFVQLGEGGVDGGEVLLDDGFAALAIGLLDGFFDLRNGFFAGQDAADGEEAGLHDGVDAGAHAVFAGDGEAIDDDRTDLLVEDGLLDGARQVLPDVVGTVGAVEQEDSAGLGGGEDIDLLEELELWQAMKFAREMR